MTFSDMLNSIPCGIWLVNTETRTIIEVNSAACDLLQLTRESILGQTCRSFLCLDKASACPIIDHNETIENREYLMCDAYGTCFPVLKSVTRVRYQNSDCLLESFVDLRKQKENEQALVESEINFRTFFETLDDLIFIASPQGRIYYTNNAVSQKLGYSKSDLQNMHVLDVHPPEYRTEAEGIYGAMFKGEKTTCPLPLQKKSGEWLQVETRVWLGRWGGRDCLYGLVKDLSAQKAALDRFEKVFQNNPAMMAISSYSSHKFVDINTAFLERLGYQREEVLGRTPSEMNLFQQPSVHLEASQKFFDSGKIKNIELKVRTKAGDVLEGLFSGETIDNQGEKSLLTVAIDVSEIRKLERELKAAEELRQTRDFLENLIELANAPILVWDAHFCITKFNRAAERLTGLAADEVIGRNIASLIPEDMQKLARSFVSEIAKGQQWEAVEIPIRRVSGEERVVLWSTATLYAADGCTIDATIAQGQDITERKKMEERLAERTVDLEKVNRLLRAEIRKHKVTQNQLRSLSATLAKTEESERRRIASDLHDHIIQNLVYANMSLSRIRDRAGEQWIADISQEVHQYLQQTIQELRTLTFEISSPVLYELGFIPAIRWLTRQFEEKHHLHIRLEEKLKAPVSEQVSILLFQAVRELLTNVVKHAKATQVQVHIVHEKRLLKIIVEDDGVGLDRASPQVNADQKTGFGMFNIRERIGSLNGTMKVKSREGKGTRVELALPCSGRS